MFKNSAAPLKIMLVLLFNICLIHSAQAQKNKNPKSQSKQRVDEVSDPYFGEKVVDYTNRKYDDEIRTIILHSSGSELEPPIINLDGTETLILRFDDLSEDVREMNYTFEHCTHDWQSSDLQMMDFQEGFNSDIISDYQFSFNTVRNYTNYRLQFPNDRIRLTRSGNYIIKVYANNDPEDIMFVARFMVVEPRAMIDPTIRNSSVVSDRDRRQELDIKVNLGNVPTTNPFGDIELVVLQNYRWDNAKRGVKPSFVKDNTLIYDYQNELTFDGGNEFRFFDAKSVRYRSENVSDVKLEADGYHIYLTPQKSRAYSQYMFQRDINGRLLVKNDDMQDAHLESDYVQVHFTMPVDAMLGNGNVFIFGQLSNWSLNKDYRMNYDAENLAYEKTLLLKQGYYNYMYLWQYVNKETGETSLTEGNHSETENEYLILVYFKDQSYFSDRLIGFKKFSTLAN